MPAGFSNEAVNPSSQKGKRTFLHLLLLFSASLMTAFFSHLFFLTEALEGRYMTGINDGLSQMLPLKQLLYEQYRSGNFFYSSEFGLGGGIYSQLGYYFSNSILFILTAIITFVLERLQLIQEPDLFYWADILLVISIIRMSLIIMMTVVFYRYLQARMLPAFVGAVLYGSSVIYFRHVTYWEFFADAMLWLPILLYGVEKIIREKRSGWFIAGIAICMFDNFYFSYVNFLLAGIYIIFRWFNPLTFRETGKLQQVKLYLAGALIGFGISAVSFIPSVYGYLNNQRPPYEAALSLFEFHDNLLLNGRIIILPAFVVLCLFVLSFYKDRLFRLFAGLVVLLTVLHYSPVVASAFNGFSAPQYRWEYFLAFAAGGVAASGLQQLNRIKSRQALVATACTISLYAGFYYMDPSLSFSSLKEAYAAIAAASVIIFFLLFGWKKEKQLLVLLPVILWGTSLFVSYHYQEQKISLAGGVNQVSKEFMLSDEYNGQEQRELIAGIQKIKEKEGDSLSRIDWMIETRNNTPVVQEFKGFSVYSSILNKHLLSFYLSDLEIDMGRESVSRYASLGDRASLYSVLSGKYYIAEKGQSTIPYGFEEILSTENYTAFRNTNSLPFARAADKVFLEEDLADASPVAKERAILEGIVLKDGDRAEKEVPTSENIIDRVEVVEFGAVYRKEILDVTEESGGVDLMIENPDPNVQDYYLSFYLKSQKEGGRKDEFPLTVNDYTTSRKFNSSIYKTNVNHITVRVPKEEKISIRVPKGKYEFGGLELYEEDYQVLQSVKEEIAAEPYVAVDWSDGNIQLSYDNESNQQYLAFPVPFEKGWTAYVNGEKQKVERANYAFIGIKLQEGINNIELKYMPPYFSISLLLTTVSLVTAVLVIRKKRHAFIPAAKKSKVVRLFSVALKK